jgi:hypothetical protein
MKKLFVLMFLLTTTFFLISCQEEASIEAVINGIDITFADTDSFASVTTHVGLPLSSERNKNAILSWESSYPSIIDNYGTVNRPEINTDVTLTVTVILGSQSLTRDFYVTVLGLYRDVTVTFKVQENIIKTVTVKAGEYISRFANPSVEGYTFDGWYIAPELTTRFEFTQPVNQTMTVEAKLTEILMGSYTIEVYVENIDDENYTLESTTTLTAPLDSNVQLPLSMKGFTLNDELSQSSGIVTDTPTTYKLYFDRNSYVVTFISEGVEIGYQNLIYGENVEMPLGLVKENHILDGWTIDQTHLVQFDFDSKISSDITLYAKWIPDASDLTSIDFSGFSNYYTQLETSNDIISDLAKLLRGSIDYVSYGDARYVYTKYDNDSQVILYDVPSSVSYRKVPAYGTVGWGSGGVITTSTFTVTINREHIWACNDMQIMPINSDRTLDGYVGYKINNGSFDDRPSNTDRGHYSDLHNLWNSLATPNQTHSDHFFGEENGSSISSYLLNDAFYPGDEYKGDIARALFYMTLMYPYLTLVEKGSPNAYEGYIYYGYLDILLKWNEEDPVSYYEIERNQTIFNEQGNRNPFIDFYDYDFANLIFSFGDPNVLD